MFRVYRRSGFRVYRRTPDPHTSGSSAHTDQDHPVTNLGALPGHEDTSHWPDVQLYQIFLWVGWGGVGWGGVGWGGVGWGGVGTITNLGALPGHEDTPHWPDVQLYQIFLWVGWVGVGLGGDNNKPWRLTRTWQLRWADLHLYKSRSGLVAYVVTWLVGWLVS